MALFNMADQYSTGDSGVDLSTSESKKRSLDGAGEGRPSFKRSNLGGTCQCIFARQCVEIRTFFDGFVVMLLCVVTLICLRRSICHLSGKLCEPGK